MMAKGRKQRRGVRPVTPDNDGKEATGNTVRLFGIHAVAATLANPERRVRRLLVTPNAEDALTQALARNGTALPDLRETASPRDLEVFLGTDAVHQGAGIEVEPLSPLVLEDVDAILNPDANALVVVLDQVSDPHNVGAILRSAAAFGAAALVTQDRHSPGETGSLAKAASGGLEAVPWVRVTNLARTLGQLADLGFWRVGLDGEASDHLAAIKPGGRVALVLGSEGRGMRPNTRAHCDMLARLPITNKVESLNVSNAAAVALYELARP